MCTTQSMEQARVCYERGPFPSLCLEGACLTRDAEGGEYWCSTTAGQMSISFEA